MWNKIIVRNYRKFSFKTAEGFCLVSHKANRTVDARSLLYALLNINRNQTGPLSAHSSKGKGKKPKKFSIRTGTRANLFYLKQLCVLTPDLELDLWYISLHRAIHFFFHRGKIEMRTLRAWLQFLNSTYRDQHRSQ